MKMRVRAEEKESMYALFALYNELFSIESRMGVRIKATPNGLRDVRMIRAVLLKLIDRLLQTFPDDSLIAIKPAVKGMRYRCWMNHHAIESDDEYTAIQAKALNTVLHEVHEKCVTCVDMNCDHCKLGKALDKISVVSRQGSWAFEKMEGENE